MAIILANGKFDILHAGHFNLLMYCRKLAGENGMLIVLIDSDARIKKNHGSPPIFHQSVRKENLEMIQGQDHRWVIRERGNQPSPSFALIDSVETFDSDEELIDLIKRIGPDYLVKGDDWTGKTVIGADIVPCLLFKTVKTSLNEKMSSSTIVKTILERNGLR